MRGHYLVEGRLVSLCDLLPVVLEKLNAAVSGQEREAVREEFPGPVALLEDPNLRAYGDRHTRCGYMPVGTEDVQLVTLADTKKLKAVA